MFVNMVFVSDCAISLQDEREGLLCMYVMAGCWSALKGYLILLRNVSVLSKARQTR